MLFLERIDTQEVGILGGYVLKRLLVPKVVYELVQEWVSGLSEAEAHVFKHVLGSQLCQTWDEGWVPLSQAWVREHFGRKVSVKKLVEAGLLESQAYDVKAGVCQRFRVSGGLWSSVLHAVPDSLDAIARGGQLDLFQGNPGACEKTGQHDEGRNLLPEPVRQALAGYRKTIINHQAMQALLAQREREAQDEAALARYRHDKACLMAVARQGFSPDDATFGHYQPAYAVGSTGRVFQLGGGLQAATREMKAAAYAGVPGVKNYDMKDAQLVCLLRELRLAAGQGLAVELGWVEAYLSEPDSKQRYAAAVGVSVEAWKDLLYSLLMGALPDGPSLRGILRRETPEEAEREWMLVRFLAVTYPVQQAVYAWYGYLAGLLERAPASKRGRYWQNACGAKYYFESDLAASRPRALRKLACHILQGLERAFVMRLEQDAAHYGFSLQANEHDGLVVLGTIPEGLVEAAAIQLGLEGLQLVEKPLGSDVVS